MIERAFSRSLYVREAVHAAVAAYDATARAEVEETASAFVVRLDGDEEMMDWFSDHVLHETIVRRRAS